MFNGSSSDNSNGPRRIPDLSINGGLVGGELRGNLSTTSLAATGQMNNAQLAAQPVFPPRPPPPPIVGNSPQFYGGAMNNFGGYSSSYGNGLFNSSPFGGGYGNNYYSSSYGGGMFGGGGGYYNNYGGGDSDFFRLAEQNSRSAFQSVESVVMAFASVSQMLESTLNAFYSSFRAVIGVADQFSRLKHNFQNIFATLAIVRFVRWLWRRLLVVFRLRSPEFAEQAWRAGAELPTAADVLSGFGNATGKAKSATNWPLLAFIGVAIGGPMLIYKLMGKMVATLEESRKWATGESEYYLAVGLYDFLSSSQQEVSFNAGQQIRIAPKNLQPQIKGWLMGTVDGQQIGLVPANYIRVVGIRPGSTVEQPKNVESLPSSSNLSTDQQQLLPNFDTSTYERSFEEVASKKFG